MEGIYLDVKTSLLNNHTYWEKWKNPMISELWRDTQFLWPPWIGLRCLLQQKKNGHRRQIIYEDYIVRDYAHFILKYLQSTWINVELGCNAS
jgi:hypothetical protein